MEYLHGLFIGDYMLITSSEHFDSKTPLVFLPDTPLVFLHHTPLVLLQCCILIQENKTWHKVLRTLY